MRIRPFPSCTSNRKSQHGSAILIILTIIGIGAAFLLVSALNKANSQIGRDKITAAALAQAKEALIGYAAGVDISNPGPRPGDLPCPDINNDGSEEIGCGNAAGSTGQNLRLGRLPWKSLGLPDLRDGYGERLWYAVSNNFKKKTRTICTSPGMAGCLNSDTSGTITVRDSNGNIIFDATGTTGVIAVIFAPGSSLTRQGSPAQQDRTCAPCNAQEVCTAAPPTNTPRCNPVNYLDIALGEDNANFQDSNTNGFIQGPVNAAGATILNDRLLTITTGDLMPTIEKRVAGEALTCLTEYAAKLSNQGRYPWAAPLNPSAAPNYSDASGSRFGRIPDTLFTATKSDSGNVMDDSWTGNCRIISSSGWWLNWKEMVFFSLADAYKPVPAPMPVPACGTTGTCLTVNPPSATANKQVSVFVAGRRLAGVASGQPRTSNNDKGTITNYLENQNATPSDGTFERNAITPTFNDATAFAPKN